MDPQLERLRTRVASVSDSARAAPAVPSQANDDERQPSTHRLLGDVLDKMDAQYVVDDGELYGRWESGLFQFSELGETDRESIVQVHGTWERYLPEGAYSRAAEFCNEWNAENAWPKAYARIDEEHRVVGIFGETTIDLGAGPTFGQVEIIVHQGIGTALGLFEAAAEAFPDAHPIE